MSQQGYGLIFISSHGYKFAMKGKKKSSEGQQTGMVENTAQRPVC